MCGADFPFRVSSLGVPARSASATTCGRRARSPMRRAARRRAGRSPSRRKGRAPMSRAARRGRKSTRRPLPPPRGAAPVVPAALRRAGVARSAARVRSAARGLRFPPALRRRQPRGERPRRAACRASAAVLRSCRRVARHAPRRAPLGPSRAPRVASRDRHGDGDAERDARLSDGVGARPMDRDVGAAVGDALVRPAGGRDQADLGLFLPRHERQSARAHLRARLRQCARHRVLHARRRPPHHGQGRLARRAGRAGLPARRAGLRLRALHHRAGAGLERLPLRPHARRPDAALRRLSRLQSARGVGRGGRGAGARAVRAAGPRSGRHRLGRSAPQERAAEAAATDRLRGRTRSATSCRSPSPARTARTRACCRR